MPAAIASISTTPNDSPCSDGAQNTSADRSRAIFSSSVTRPSHSNRGSPAVERVSSLGVGAVAADPHPYRQRVLLHRLDEHVETLAFLVAAAEEHDRIVAVAVGPRRGRSDLVEFDTVEQHLVLAAEVALCTSANASFDTTTL